MLFALPVRLLALTWRRLRGAYRRAAALVRRAHTARPCWWRVAHARLGGLRLGRGRARGGCVAGTLGRVRFGDLLRALGRWHWASVLHGRGHLGASGSSNGAIGGRSGAIGARGSRVGSRSLFAALRDVAGARPTSAAEWPCTWLTHWHASNADVLGRERQHGQPAGALQRDIQRALMRRACAGFAAGLDLAALRQETTQATEVLVIDFLDLVDAERAHLAARGELASSTGAKFTRTAAASRASASRRGRSGGYNHRSLFPFSGLQPPFCDGSRKVG